MSRLLRHFAPGKLYFITCVTQGRKPLLQHHASLLLDVLNHYSRIVPFGLIGYVILSDHFHMLIDPRESRPDRIVQRIKLSFSGRMQETQLSKRRSHWQRRYWDHHIRNQLDLNRHLDYIHSNPVKHGHVDDPAQWQYSSFREFVEAGCYPAGWGQIESPEIVGDFGE